jgi:hypothetical protein
LAGSSWGEKLYCNGLAKDILLQALLNDRQEKLAQLGHAEIARLLGCDMHSKSNTTISSPVWCSISRRYQGTTKTRHAHRRKTVALNTKSTCSLSLSRTIDRSIDASRRRAPSNVMVVSAGESH